MYKCESWALNKAEWEKNWCFCIVGLEKTLESPLDCKEIQPVHAKGNQSWIFIWRTDAEAETPILQPPDGKNWLIGKDPDTGKDWRWKKKGMTEDDMVGWHHQLNGHEFKQVPGVGDGQGGLACCSPWGHWGSDTTERLHFHVSLSFIGEGNGSPLQCSYLENPEDGGAWWAAVYGVTQSRTRLKRFSSSKYSYFCRYHICLLGLT